MPTVKLSRVICDFVTDGQGYILQEAGRGLTGYGGAGKCKISLS